MRFGRRRRAVAAVVTLALALGVGVTFNAVTGLSGASGGIPSTYDGVALSVPQAIQAAYSGGFKTENQLSSIVEIGLAESSLTTKARNWHPEYGLRPASDVIDVQSCAQNPGVWNASCTQQISSDRGWLQISTHFWPQFTDPSVDNPVTAAADAFIISKNGTDFSPWDTLSISAQFDAQVRPQVKTFLAGSPTTTTVGGGTTTTVKSSGTEVRHPGTYTTAYDWQDNNPPNSGEISNPVIHQTAGGTGTFADPLTVAVDHLSNGALQFPKGTKFYVPNVRAYLIAEDTTGETAPGTIHLDMWAGGQTSTQQSAYNCMSAVTGHVLVIENPASNYVVIPGSLSANNTCRSTFGDAVVTSGGVTTTTVKSTTTTGAPTTTTRPVTTTTVPSGPRTWFQCVNAAGVGEATRSGFTKQTCAHSTDRYISWTVRVG